MAVIVFKDLVTTTFVEPHKMPHKNPNVSDMTVHLLAESFPLLEGDEYKELSTDIDVHGQIDEIVVHKGQILDGRNRLRVCQELGRQPIFIEFSKLKFNGSPEEFILSQNLHRRHLTVDQRAMVAVEFIYAEESAAKERQKSGKGSDGSGGRGNKKNPVVESPEGLSAGTTRSKTAKKAKVSEHKIRQAKKVKDADPALAEEVKTGKTKLSDAEKQVSQRKPKRKSKEKSKHITLKISNRKSTKEVATQICKTFKTDWTLSLSRALKVAVEASEHADHLKDAAKTRKK